MCQILLNLLCLSPPAYLLREAILTHVLWRTRDGKITIFNKSMNTDDTFICFRSIKVLFCIGILVYVAGNSHSSHYNLLHCRILSNIYDVGFGVAYCNHNNTNHTFIFRVRSLCISVVNIRCGVCLPKVSHRYCLSLWDNFGTHDPTVTHSVPVITSVQAILGWYPEPRKDYCSLQVPVCLTKHS